MKLLSLTALCGIALLQVIRFAGVGPEPLYMVPQGLVGVWVMLVGWRGASLLTVIIYFGR